MNHMTIAATIGNVYHIHEVAFIAATIKKNNVNHIVKSDSHTFTTICFGFLIHSHKE